MTKEAFGDLIIRISIGLFIALLLGILAFGAYGCGGEAPSEDEAADLGKAPDLDTLIPISDDLYQGRPGGGLPPGYNQRQCQWDACGGPLPTDRGQAVTNPVREDGR